MNEVGNVVTNVNGQQSGGEQQVVTQVAQQPVVQTQVQQPQSSQALFTQDQLNSIISGRINPLNQKISELSNQLADQQKLSATYLTELNGYKNREAAVAAGVPQQFVDYAVFEAQKLAVNGKSMEDAIKEFVSANATLFGNPQQGVQGNASTTPNGQQPTGVSATPTQTTQQQQSIPNQAQAQATQPQAGQPQASVQAQPAQFGSTTIQGGGNPANTAGVDADVDAFLRSRGLKK